MMRRLFCAVLLAAFAACSSGGSAIAPQSLPGFAPAVRGGTFLADRRRHRRVGAFAHIVIPRRRPRTHRGRGPDFVSPSTRGIKIVATWQGGSTSSFVQTTVAALGPKAPGCTSSSSSFSCTIQATVWEGPNKIDVTTYDKPPSSSSSGSSFPANAQELGFSSITDTVTAGVTPSILIYLGGEIGSINAKPLFSSVPADGSSHDVAIAFNPKDFGGNKITAGTKDPFANPVNVTLTETGGNGHAVLLLNGSGTGSSATLQYSTDTLGVRYDGGGKSGYTIGVQMAAKGAPSEALQVSPLIVEGPGIASHALGLNGAAVANALTITEANAPSSQTYNVTRTGCAGVATVSGFSGSGASAAFTATGGATASASGCSISVADASSTTLLLPVTNTPIGGTVTINGVTLTSYAVGASPGPLAVGPDNNIWFVYNSFSNQLDFLTPTSGNPTIGGAPLTVTLSNSYGVSIYGLTAGPDHALWLSDGSSEGVDRVSLAGAGVSYSDGSVVACPETIVAANDGMLWVSNHCSGLWSMTVGGGIQPSAGSAHTASTYYLAQGADGDFYVDDGANIDKYDPVAQTTTQIPIPNGTSITGITSAPTDGATGAIWYTATVPNTVSQGVVGRIAIGSATAVTEVTVGNGATTGANFTAIAAGADGAVWMADQYNNQVDKISFSAPTSIAQYPLPDAAAISGNQTIQAMVLGPDGSLWLSEDAAGKIVHIIP